VEETRLERDRRLGREWYHKNKAHAYEVERRRRSTPEFKAARAAKKRERYAKDEAFREKAINFTLGYQKDHMQAVCIKIKRHKLRRASVPGSHTVREWQDRVAEFNNHCAYCLRVMETSTQDHMIPVSRGQQSSNDISNIVPACVSCNSSKGDQSLLEFIRR
jgi:5-methylcytosine-specific restriction endonuclease McrA